jgi:hypothetical protein
MDELAQRASRAAESILENESLTADLDDAAANVLLDWGVACAKTIAQSTAGLDSAQAEEAMVPRLRAIRQLMRSVNNWIANRQGMDAEANATSLNKIIEQATLTYGESFRPPDQDRRDAFLKQLLESTGTPQQLIADLRGLLESPSATS